MTGRRSPQRSPARSSLGANRSPKLEKAAPASKDRTREEQQRGLADTILQSDGIQALAQATGLDNWQVVGGLAALTVMMIFGFGANLACNVVGFVYPMYKSFQAIELTGLGIHEIEGGATEENLQRCVHLLMYWVVYTFFTVGEYFSDFLLFWIPFYYPLKLALLVWCLKYDGAQKLYSTTFGKLLQQYEPQINQVTEQVTKHATTFVSDVKEGGREFARDNSSRIISGASNAFTNLTSQPTPAKAD